MLDEEIKKAIRESVSEASQPETVANRLIKWLEEMSKQNLSETDKSERLDLVYDAINIDKLEMNNED
ncbi:CxC ATPase DNA modification system associated small protein [Dapis sp. BLCC M172]|uniref:CxC ATPase DNA modification system associated small protein n=1 Tax=Dapis sp. BLCC M172 TaxID=2975281 RepID=UPI003CF71E11